MPSPNDRRTFLKLLGSGAFAATMEGSIRKALAIPAHHRTGTIDDVGHIVVLMQENRSFDHYFGTLSGVRGFSDPRVAALATGRPVWYQPDGASYVLPFHPDAPDLGLQFLEDLPHDWTTTHAAWNHGLYDQWVPQKGTTTMAHLSRADIPYHYALADAFTVCDAYHCSILSSTDPNRYYMWTGWVGNDGKAGGPVVDNAEAGYDWHTYPERMQAAGITWTVYQDVGAGLTAAESWGWGSDAYIGNYGDNSLLYFHQYQNAPDNSPLAERARTGTDIKVSGTLFDRFRADVLNGTLPQVSWIAAPEAYCEHPNWPANYGAWYVSQILDILTANPEVWSRTVFLLTYDENDGFFDHVVPPTPAATATTGGSTVSTANEFFPGSAHYAPGPYGLGIRVPMLVISPWSKGGYVNSQVFDHTSIIRFIEARFAKHDPSLIETNITPWRRAVCGDLTSCFDFRTPNAARVAPPPTAGYAPPDAVRHPDYKPAVPAAQAMPTQEP
ncbi:MAG: phospholipase C, phosphocholine-specific, partial [Gluconacetobacter diazotrophicus]|nr:phospholipase C, phosphocholine-specific [Gluconacetobacter diazotrophicus]